MSLDFIARHWLLLFVGVPVVVLAWWDILTTCLWLLDDWRASK